MIGTGHGGTRAIVVDGQQAPCTVEVVPWQVSGLHFSPLRKRRLTDFVVLHWTGSENPPETVHHTLSDKGLSVHFVIDPFGTIYQMADAAMLCMHAQGVNDRAVGVELICRGDGPKTKSLIARRRVSEAIHDQLVEYDDFTPEQQVSAIALCSALCRAFSLPMQVPINQAGEVFSTVLLQSELSVFRGVIGHYHTKLTKRDPGPKLLRLIHSIGGIG